MAALLLILSLILTAMIHLNRKRSRTRQEVIVPIDFDAPPAYSISLADVLSVGKALRVWLCSEAAMASCAP